MKKRTQSIIFLVCMSLAPQAFSQSINSSDTTEADWCAEACYGTVIEKGTLNNKGNKHGKWVGRYQKTKDIAMEGAYFNGKRTGIWTFYMLKKYADKGDGKVLQGVYQKGVKVKKWKRFSEGQVTWTLVYSKNGQQVVSTRYNDGKIRRIVHEKKIPVLKNGKKVKHWVKDGPFTEYSFGVTRGTYRKGKRHGVWISRSTKNQIVRKGKYQNGTKIGLHQSFYSNGRKYCIERFNGKNGSATCWDRFGNKNKAHAYIASSTNVSGYVKHGTYSEWTQGQLTQRGMYKQGNKVGTWTKWHANGKMMSKGKFALQYPFWNTKKTRKNSYTIGSWRTYHPNGKLASEGEYKSGAKIGTWRHWTNDGKRSKLKVHDGRNGKVKISPWR